MDMSLICGFFPGGYRLVEFVQNIQEEVTEADVILVHLVETDSLANCECLKEQEFIVILHFNLEMRKVEQLINMSKKNIK
jgi:hypothetical protein